MNKFTNDLWDKSMDEIVYEIKKANEATLLHEISKQYNWDDGLDIPEAIINNKYCDLGTALKIFYDAQGYELFKNKSQEIDKGSPEWIGFIKNVYDLITERKFESERIKFKPTLTKTQIYKIKKINPDIDLIFIEGIQK